MLTLSRRHRGRWLITGIGLRFAQDIGAHQKLTTWPTYSHLLTSAIGAHREKVYGADHPFENQLWKRAFWCLVVIDKLFSASK